MFDLLPYTDLCMCLTPLNYQHIKEPVTKNQREKAIEKKLSNPMVYSTYCITGKDKSEFTCRLKEDTNDAWRAPVFPFWQTYETATLSHKMLFPPLIVISMFCTLLKVFGSYRTETEVILGLDWHVYHLQGCWIRCDYINIPQALLPGGPAHTCVVPTPKIASKCAESLCELLNHPESPLDCVHYVSKGTVWREHF